MLKFSEGKVSISSVSLSISVLSVTASPRHIIESDCRIAGAGGIASIVTVTVPDMEHAEVSVAVTVYVVVLPGVAVTVLPAEELKVAAGDQV